MAVLESEQDLNDDVKHFRLVKLGVALFFLVNACFQIASRSIFHDDVEIHRSILIGIMEFDDVRVVESLKNDCLLPSLPSPILIHSLHVDSLDDTLDIRWFRYNMETFSMAALSQPAQHFVFDFSSWLDHLQ